MRWVITFVILAACRLGFDNEATTTPDADAPPANTAHVTIQRQGTGTGTIVGPGGFTCLDATCTLDVPFGTSVTLRGLAADAVWFAGWRGPCGGNFECTVQVDADMTILAEFSPQPNRMFVTSTTTDGAFGGLAGGDAICAARATAAGLTGTFIAFLSDSVTNAVSRISSSRGWIRIDGAPFADAPTAFASGPIVFPPRLDEYGNDLGNVQVFTGTSAGATAASLCVDWTSNLTGNLGAMASTQYASSAVSTSDRACDTQGHLLCIETDRVMQVQALPNTGKLAFTSRTAWTPGGGRADADALCANEATAAGLGGTFLAAVATTTETIESRFPAGAIYRRVDGVRLFRDAGLFTTDWLDVPPEQDQLGNRLSMDLWTGTTRFSELPTAADNCNDWTDGTTALSGKQHFSTKTDVRTPTKTEPCNVSTSLLCLEY